MRDIDGELQLMSSELIRRRIVRWANAKGNVEFAVKSLLDPSRHLGISRLEHHALRVCLEFIRTTPSAQLPKLPDFKEYVDRQAGEKYEDMGDHG